MEEECGGQPEGVAGLHPPCAGVHREGGEVWAQCADSLPCWGTQVGGNVTQFCDIDYMFVLRAGTTAILCLMHLAGLDCDKAITTAKSLRSMIEPIGDFRQLLTRCDGMQRSVGGKFTR